jgi:hypothetical protein
VFELSISLLAIPVLWALAEWRLGLILCLVTAILQDPLRKLTPGQPVVFIVFVGVVFAAMCLGALARGVPLNSKVIFKRYQNFVMPFSLLLMLIVVQAANSYLRFGNLIITLLGLMTYGLPLLSIVCAYQLVCRQGQLRMNQFIKWYIVCVGLALATVYLEYSGYKWPVLGGVGPKIIIFDPETGLILLSFAGLFRAPEIAAWHAMTAASFAFLIIMNSSKRITIQRLLMAAIVAALLIGLGLLTGRRKLVVEFAVFISTYFILWAIFERGLGKLAAVTFIGVTLIAYAWLAAEVREDVSNYNTDMAAYSRYVAHSQYAFSQVPQRFVELGIAPVTWAYYNYGLFGAGLGAGTQGTQHFGGGATVTGGAGEGGLGKITIELGVPGLFVLGWIAILGLRQMLQILRFASRYSTRIARISFGLLGFLVANVAGFSVATQAYSDVFILLILSWILAFLLAVPALVEREVRARQVASFEELSPVFRPKMI